MSTNNTITRERTTMSIINEAIAKAEAERDTLVMTDRERLSNALQYNAGFEKTVTAKQITTFYYDKWIEAEFAFYMASIKANAEAYNAGLTAANNSDLSEAFKALKACYALLAPIKAKNAEGTEIEIDLYNTFNSAECTANGRLLASYASGMTKTKSEVLQKAIKAKNEAKKALTTAREENKSDDIIRELSQALDRESAYVDDLKKEAYNAYREFTANDFEKSFRPAFEAHIGSQLAGMQTKTDTEILEIYDRVKAEKAAKKAAKKAANKNKKNTSTSNK